MPGGRGAKYAPAQHGGDRTPAHPAAVSGPGALSRRTDGGAAQPVRPIPAANQGDRQASVALQQGAPLAAVDPSPSAGPAAAPAGPAPVGDPAPDPFGPTRRPGEPLTAGAALGPGSSPPDPNESTVAFLLELYRQHENDDIRAVLEELQSGMGR